MAKIFTYKKAADAVDEQRYFVIELLRSDVRMGRKISDTLRKEVKKLDRLQDRCDKIAAKVLFGSE